MTTYRTKWGSDTIEISADFAQASCQVKGVPGGRQVADFRHEPERAMRRAVEACASSEGMDMDDEETEEAIDAAVESMVRVD